MLLRPIGLLACLLFGAAVQAQGAPGLAAEDALGFRMTGLDLAVFDVAAKEAEGEAFPPASPLPSLRASVLYPEATAQFPLTDTSATGSDTDQRPNALRLATLVGGSAGAALFVIDHQRRRWWTDRSPTFRVRNDWEYVLWTDKFGHYYSAALLTRLYRGSLRWAGVSESQARLWGAVGGFSNMLYFEVLDGFGPQWGFSPGDLAFNTLGVFVATAQADDPRVDAFRVKWSYWPSGWEGKNPIDDYAGQTYWMTLNPHRLAPEAARRYLPPWLNVAVAYGSRDRDELDYLTTSLVYVGLDLELSGLPIDHPVWNRVTEVLRYIHLPGPALRIAPDVAFEPFAY